MSDIEHELIATQWDLKVAKDRIKRLEKAGDKMHDWLMSKNRIGCDMEIASEWTRAKKNKPAAIKDFQNMLSYEDAINKIRQLDREVEVLRLHGNKDCTAMADEVLAKEAIQRDTKP